MVIRLGPKSLLQRYFIASGHFTIWNIFLGLFRGIVLIGFTNIGSFSETVASTFEVILLRDNDTLVSSFTLIIEFCLIGDGITIGISLSRTLEDYKYI